MMILSLLNFISIFSQNGLTFDTFLPSYNFTTNYYNHSFLPPCGNILVFQNDFHSTCKWIDNNHIETTLVLHSNTSPLLSLNDKIYANQSLIVFQNLDLYYETILQPNETPLVPQVIISAPYEVNICNSFEIDVTSSINSLYRSWKLATLQITGDFLTIILANHDVSKPLIIPGNYLVTGYTYLFTYTLCNFMNACNSATHSIYATNKNIPFVSILGSNSISIFASQSLTMNSISYIQKCNGIKINSGLSYNWTIIGANLDTYSTSDFLYISPYSLPILGGHYKITLSVFSITENISSSSFVDLYVKKPSLSISHSLNQNLPLDSTLSIDVTTNYHTIIQSELIFFEYNVLPQNSNIYLIDFNSFFSLIPQQNAIVGEKIQIEIFAYIPSLSINTSSFLFVTIVAPNEPSALISNLIEKPKYNSKDFIKLRASVSSFYPLQYNWTFNSPNYKDILKSHCLTPFFSFLSSGDNNVFFILKPYALSSSSVYTFTFSIGNIQSSINISINEPPKNGNFIVSPNNGIELNTSFFFESNFWTDSDLPLKYLYGYFLQDDFIVRGFNQIHYSYSFLPFSSLPLLCYSTIIDSYDADTNEYYNVNVNKLNLQLNQFNHLIQEKLENKANDINSVKNIVSVSSSILNSNNCSNLPFNCPQLNRENCFSTVNTCGKCLNGFIGLIGDSNSMCFDNNKNNNNNNNYFEKKTCNNNCSNNGICIYKHKLTGELWNDNCLFNMPYCEPVCKCNDSFFGPFCDYDNVTLFQKMEIRKTLVNSLFDIVYFDSPSQQTIENWVANLLSISSFSHELEINSIYKLLDLLPFVIDKYIEFNLDVYNIQSLLPLLELHYNQSLTFTIIDKINSYISVNLLNSQNPVTFICNNIRTISSYSSYISVPLFDYESAFHMNSTQLSLFTNSHYNPIIQLSSFTENYYNSDFHLNNTSILSDPLRIHLNSFTVDNDLFFTVKFFNYHKQNFSSTNGSIFKTICLENDFANYSFSCNNDAYIIWHNCTGNKRIIQSKCSDKSIVPVCFHNGSDYVSCNLINFTNFTTFCNCSLNTINRRKLSQNNDVIDLINVNKEIIKDFQETIISADDIKLSDLHSSYYVLLLFSVSWGTGFVLLLTYLYNSYHKNKTHPNDKGLSLSSCPNNVHNNHNILDSNFVNSIFPDIYKNSFLTFTDIFREIKRNHKHLNLLNLNQLYENKCYILNVFYILSIHTLLFFMLAIFYDIEYPNDDGSCLTYTSKYSCLQKKSFINSNVNKCMWTDIENENIVLVDNAEIGGLGYIPSCFYKEPEFNLFNLIMYSIFSTYIVIPFVYLIDFLFWSILDAPLLKSSNYNYVSFNVNDFYNNFLSDIKNITSNIDLNLHNNENQNENENEINNDINIDVFKQEWGLDENNVICDSQFHIFDRVYCLQYNTSFENIVKKEMNSSYNNFKNIIKFPINNQVILQIFALDLLGYKSNEYTILKHKLDNDFQLNNKKCVSINQQIGAYMLLFFINCFFVIFTIVRSIERGPAWQKTFLQACVFQFIAEIIFYESSECFVLDYYIPYSIKDKVLQTKNTIFSLLDKQNKQNNDFVRKINMCRYFFTSFHIASLFPFFTTSKLISNYHSYLPCNSLSQKWKKCLIENNSNLLYNFSLTKYFSRSLIFFSTLSPFIQKLTINTLQPFFMSIIIALFVFINQNPYLFVFIFIIFLYKVFYYFKDKNFNLNLSKKVSVDKFHNIVNISNNYTANNDTTDEIEICSIHSIDCDNSISHNDDSLFIDSLSLSSCSSDGFDSDTNSSYYVSSNCSSDFDSNLSYCSDYSWSA
jgi:hypothetical protein